MTEEGQMLGTIDNLVVDTDTGTVALVLDRPKEGLEPRPFPIDPAGRLALPFTSLRAVQDDAVLDLGT